ncbi:sensor histidine kinase [Dyadobacter beijingensis]|nr:histidine kinase [Dyadobacter beijingensis]
MLIWGGVWYIIRYFAIPSLTKDNDEVVRHAAVVVFAQSLFIFYTIGYLTFPRLLYKGKFLILLLVLLGLFQLIYITNFLEFRYLVSISDSRLPGNPLYVSRVWDQHMSQRPLTACLTDFLMAYLNYSWSFYYVTPLLAVKTTIDLVRTRTRNLVLERDRFKLESENLSLATQRLSLQRDYLVLEVNFLRSQISPHFLFNTLNAVYNRIVDADELAAELIAKIASLMQYTLYLANKDQVAVEDEARYIDNYLGLERARFGEDVDIQFEYTAQNESLQIAPLLLISFVENAFKHGVSLADDNPFVHVALHVTDSRLVFTSKNSIITFDPDAELEGSDGRNGGIGLENTAKRLSLLYPERHQLRIQALEEVFEVELVIQF